MPRKMHTRLVIGLSARESQLWWNLEIFESLDIGPGNWIQDSVVTCSRSTSYATETTSSLEFGRYIPSKLSTPPDSLYFGPENLYSWSGRDLFSRPCLGSVSDYTQHCFSEYCVCFRKSLESESPFRVIMMMIAFITIKSSLVPLIEGLCAQIYFRFEILVVWSHLLLFFFVKEKTC